MFLLQENYRIESSTQISAPQVAFFLAFSFPLCLYPITSVPSLSLLSDSCTNSSSASTHLAERWVSLHHRNLPFLVHVVYEKVEIYFQQYKTEVCVDKIPPKENCKNLIFLHKHYRPLGELFPHSNKSTSIGDKKICSS